MLKDDFLTKCKKYPNLDFPEAFEKSQAELSRTTAQINADFNRREAEIMAECKRRTSGYDQVGANLQGQLAAKSGPIQVTPQGTNMYARNYINFGGGNSSARIEPVHSEPQKALMATPKSLNKDLNGKGR